MDLQELAKVTAGFSGSDIASVCMKAARLALTDFLSINKQVYRKKDFQKLKISKKYFYKVIEDKKISVFGEKSKNC